MGNSTTVKKISKLFDRKQFERVKAFQTSGLSRTQIVERVDFGAETIRKAMKAPNWSQYRKNELKSLRDRRERTRVAKEAADYVAPEEPAFIETPQQIRYKAVKSLNGSAIVAVVVIAILLSALVLFLVVKH